METALILKKPSSRASSLGEEIFLDPLFLDWKNLSGKGKEEEGRTALSFDGGSVTIGRPHSSCSTKAR